jgi:hypothetical protein
VRENKETMALEEAMKEAIEYCIGHNVLSGFLIKHGSEVINMLLTEWNTDDAKVIWREEGWEDGREEGLEEGLEKGRAEGREEGLEEGLEKGREEGLEKGRKEVQTILNLVRQGYTAEQIEKVLASGAPQPGQG